MLQYDDVMKLDFGTHVDGNLLKVLNYSEAFYYWDYFSNW